MVSTMGNGFTFPMQTILFSAIVRSVYRVLGVPPSDGKLNQTWSVFGDDIIVRPKAYDIVVRILKLLGFSVNEKKSFKEGFFKESCGLDAFKGVDIRGVYLKDIHPQVSHYVIYNRLFGWSSGHLIKLPRTLRYLLSFGDLRVPLWEADDAGYKFPLRWAGEVDRDRNGSFKYRKMLVDPIRLLFRDGVVKGTAKGMKGRVYNPAGHFLAALHGCCQNDAVVVRAPRGMTVRYRTRECVGPNWGQRMSTSAEMRVDESWLTTMLDYIFLKEE